MNFLSLEEAKNLFNVNSFDIRRNKNTGKLSILLPTGEFLKVQQDITKSKEVAFMYEDNPMEGCLINVDRTSPLEKEMSI